MKATHRSDIFTYSAFDAARNLDFNGTVVVRPQGNVVVDPMPLTEHDAQHLLELGGVWRVVITNSDHVRAGEALRDRFGAEIAGPAAERDGFPIGCEHWVQADTRWGDDLEFAEVHGSKTPGELAIVCGDTLVTGDLIRGHVGGKLNLLPDPKLTDHAAAVASVRALADRPQIAAVLVGDGWPVFREGHARLVELANALG
ncbi:MAG: MBL fold metallo-hydrolase [Myxococcota bacterium]